MRPQEIIAKKRGGETLTGEEIDVFVSGVTDGTWADYQASALLMAIYINGFSPAEQFALTAAMLDSGSRHDFSDVEQPKADKHSTGGVGDKTSLIVAPLVAACGVSVPMISGRGLGHTGGTLDKLESIAGYDVNLSTAEFKRVVKNCGFAMSGQTADIAPADKKLYALRDATATVESVPLIVASIMSKKLAEGLDALVLDVKTGSGAFMKDFADSEKLAAALCETGNAFGVKTAAVISDMNQPLGKYVGNRLEVYECVKILRGEIGERMQPTLELSIELAARMLFLCGIETSMQNSKFKVQSAFDSGAALEKFRRNVELQNGDAAVCDQPAKLLDENVIKVAVKAEKSGFVSEINTSAIGECLSLIGGGRVKIEDDIDFAVGYECAASLSDEVEAGEILGVIYCRDQAQARAIYEKMTFAYKIEDEKPTKNYGLIKKVI